MTLLCDSYFIHNRFFSLQFLGVDGQDKLHAACDDVRDFLHRRDGSTALYQWVVYLSPGDYHRFHSPTEWTVLRRR